MEDIKKLRAMTGAGLADVKKALTEAEGDMDKAKEILRQRGQAIAAKRADRETSNGCVLAKVADGANMEAIKNAMFNGINTRKWICVEADQLRVVSSADLVMLVMADSQLGEGHADGLVEAFASTVSASQVTGGDVLAELSGEILTRG